MNYRDVKTGDTIHVIMGDRIAKLTATGFTEVIASVVEVADKKKVTFTSDRGDSGEMSGRAWQQCAAVQDAIREEIGVTPFNAEAVQLKTALCDIGQRTRNVAMIRSLTMQFSTRIIRDVTDDLTEIKKITERATGQTFPVTEF